MSKIPVAVLGATGTVGQKFIRLLEGHPRFEIRELVASPRSAGKPYEEACLWKQETPIPADQAKLTVKTTEDHLESPLLFSGLDSSIAGEVETAYANAGHLIISNSKNHRMDGDVPLIIPEINPDHFELLKRQPYAGGIITNSNCSTMFLAMALAPLHQAFGVELVQVTTMQAVSGAGYPGTPSMDILGNIIPYIKSEEEKMEVETAKILGSLSDSGVTHAPFVLSAQCNRVPVYDGHTESVSVRLGSNASVDQVIETLRTFSGMPQERKLPSAPEHPILVRDEPDRPQPARDLWHENGMATIIGRVRTCPILSVKMVLMGHNTVRGAAGAAILNAEAALELGYIHS